MDKKNLPEAQNPDFGRVAQAWEKWEDWLQPCYQSFNEKLLQKALIAEGDNVLDVGCGTGSPALSAAQLVGATGRVIGCDISQEMLDVATRRAEALRVTNVQFEKCDVTSLRYPDHSFDAATSRFCLMFLPSPQNTLREIFRVLKPGGGFSAAVWADPEKNPLPRKILERYFTIPPADPKVPGPYRFSKRGILIHFMEEARFSDPTEEEVPVEEVFLSGQQYVDHLLEASALWGSMLRKLNEKQFGEAIGDIARAAEQFRSGNEVRIPRAAFVVSGMKSK